jgi:hypothetical protein
MILPPFLSRFSVGFPYTVFVLPGVLTQPPFLSWNADALVRNERSEQQGIMAAQSQWK